MVLAKRPYLLRAYYNWIIDNELTPYLVVNTSYPNAKVPADFVTNNQIVLNISPSACANLSLGNDNIIFNARFRGVAQEVSVPLGAVTAIYARENGDGIQFDDQDLYNSTYKMEESQNKNSSIGTCIEESEKIKNKDKTFLKIIK